MKEVKQQKKIIQQFCFTHKNKDKKTTRKTCIACYLSFVVLFITPYCFATSLEIDHSTTKVALGYGGAVQPVTPKEEIGAKGSTELVNSSVSIAIEDKVANITDESLGGSLSPSNGNATLETLDSLSNESYGKVNSGKEQVSALITTNSTGENIGSNSANGEENSSRPLGQLETKGEIEKSVSSSVVTTPVKSEATTNNKKANTSVRLFNTVDFVRKSIKGNAPKWERVVNLEKKKKVFLVTEQKKGCRLTFIRVG